MLLVARKNLFSEHTRLAIAVATPNVLVVLISFLLSLYRGWNEKVGGFVEEVDADIWIAREGTTDFLAAASILPTEPLEQVSISGVEQESLLIVRPMAAHKDGKKINVHFVGYDTKTGMGGPIRIEAGKDAPGPGEVIVDKSVIDRYGVDIGGTISAANRDWKVVGVSSGGDFVASHTIFVRFEEAQAALKMGGFATFFLLKLEKPEERDRMARDLGALNPEILAITREDFASATRDRILGEILPILSVILMLAFVVGLAVSGLTIYTATVERTREYGILKAVGFTNGYLYRLVTEQSVVTGLLGFLLGAGLTIVVGPFAQDIVPQFVVFVRWQDVLVVFGVTLAMALIAAYVPVRRLAEIDPVTVFKA